MAAATTTKRTTTKELNVQPAANGRANGKAANGRVPAALATPTDLTPEQSQAVQDAVNPLIADAFALYLKTKNFHWHLSGSHFRSYHLMFDEQADAIFASIDVMAERVRRTGGTTLRSIGHVSNLQTIADDNDDFVPADEMIRRLLDDNKHIAVNIRKAIEVTEDNKDYPTSNFLQDILDDTERRIWFLFEIANGGQNEL